MTHNKIEKMIRKNEAVAWQASKDFDKAYKLFRVAEKRLLDGISKLKAIKKKQDEIRAILLEMDK